MARAVTTVFVAGGLGVMGRPTVKLLLRRGFRVAATTRHPERARDIIALGAVPVVADAFRPEGLREWVRAVRPEVVVHHLTDLPPGLDGARMAEGIERNARIRREGTANLVRACIDGGVSHVVAQGIAWAYAPTPGPADESFPLDDQAQGLRATTVAGVRALEQSVLGTPQIDGCVLRFGRVFGPGTGQDRAVADPAVHVEAAAWACALAIERHAIGAINVAEEGGRVRIDKARRQLGWEPSLRAATPRRAR